MRILKEKSFCLTAKISRKSVPKISFLDLQTAKVQRLVRFPALKNKNVDQSKPGATLDEIPIIYIKTVNEALKFALGNLYELRISKKKLLKQNDVQWIFMDCLAQVKPDQFGAKTFIGQQWLQFQKLPKSVKLDPKLFLKFSKLFESHFDFFLQFNQLCLKPYIEQYTGNLPVSNVLCHDEKISFFKTDKRKRPLKKLVTPWSKDFPYYSAEEFEQIYQLHFYRMVHAMVKSFQGDPLDQFSELASLAGYSSSKIETKKIKTKELAIHLGKVDDIKWLFLDTLAELLPRNFGPGSNAGRRWILTQKIPKSYLKNFLFTHSWRQWFCELFVARVNIYCISKYIWLERYAFYYRGYTPVLRPVWREWVNLSMKNRVL